MERKLSTRCLPCVECKRVTPFKFRGTQIAESRMATTQVVKAFEVEKDVTLRSKMRSIDLILNQFGLECSPEALHQSIVAAVAGATHTDLHRGRLQASLVVVAGILAATVGMMQQSWRRSARDQRRIKRTLDEFTYQGCVHRPSHYFPRKDVHDQRCP